MSAGVKFYLEQAEVIKAADVKKKKNLSSINVIFRGKDLEGRCQIRKGHESDRSQQWVTQWCDEPVSSLWGELLFDKWDCSRFSLSLSVYGWKWEQLFLLFILLLNVLTCYRNDTSLFLLSARERRISAPVPVPHTLFVSFCLLPHQNPSARFTSLLVFFFLFVFNSAWDDEHNVVRHQHQGWEATQYGVWQYLCAWYNIIAVLKILWFIAIY